MSKTSGPAGPAPRVWDLPTRLAHWLLVVLVPFSWWSATNHHLAWHRLSGYAVLVIIVFRLTWGVVGSDTARFAQFVRGPRAALAYLRGQFGTVVGHNPLGGWSIVAMLAVLATQVGLGLFAVDEDGLDPSPLAKFVDFDTGRLIAKAHHLNFKLLLGLIGLHLAAITVYAARGRNLVWPMVVGRGDVGVGPPAVRFTPLWIAVLVVLVAAGLAWFVAGGLSLRLPKG